MQSLGEKQVESILKNLNMEFDSEVSVGDVGRYDFVVYANYDIENNNNYFKREPLFIIEVDGCQHFNTNARNNYQKVNYLTQYGIDTLKDNFCKYSNIPLLRIKEVNEKHYQIHFSYEQLNDIIISFIKKEHLDKLSIKHTMTDKQVCKLNFIYNNASIIREFIDKTKYFDIKQNKKIYKELYGSDLEKEKYWIDFIKNFNKAY